MKPKIDHDLCIGDGICEEICPEVFEMRDDGLAYVINEEPDGAFNPQIQESIESCPTEAITDEEA